MSPNPVGRPRIYKPPCKVPDCDRTSKSQGYCPMHYARLVRTGKLEARPYEFWTGKTCLDCDEPAKQRGRCVRHYHNQYNAQYQAKLRERRESA